MNGIFSGLPQACVVKWKKHGCMINCCAVDQQAEHTEPDKAEPAPQHPVIVSCSCCWTAYRYSPPEIFKANRLLAALVLSIGGRRSAPSPSVTAKISDSIHLAEMIQARLRN